MMSMMTSPVVMPILVSSPDDDDKWTCLTFIEVEEKSSPDVPEVQKGSKLNTVFSIKIFSPTFYKAQSQPPPNEKW